MESKDIGEVITQSFNRMKRIAESARSDSPPTTLIMNGDFFCKWFFYCEERNLDPMEWEGKQILLDAEAPAPIAWSYHLTE